MRSWDGELGSTWLADVPLVAALDAWVRDEMARHHRRAARVLDPDSPGPWTVSVLASDIRRHALAGHWIWATTAICLLQELIFCVRDGAVELSRHLDASLLEDVRTLRCLRNVIAHPARMPVRVGENSTDEFCFRMERDRDFVGFASDLFDNGSLYADRRVAVFALRRLNTAGRLYARQLDLLAARPRS